MKHTKGEWEVVYTPDEVYVMDEENNIICKMQKNDITEANTRLIAAAPELLEALIQLNEGFKREWGIENNSERVSGNIDYWNKLASGVIKKATQ